MIDGAGLLFILIAIIQTETRGRDDDADIAMLLE